MIRRSAAIAGVLMLSGCSVFEHNPVPPRPDLTGVQAQNAALADRVERSPDGSAVFGPLEQARDAVDAAHAQPHVDNYDDDSLQAAEQALSKAESGWQALADRKRRPPKALAEVADAAHRAQRLAEIARFTARRELGLDRLNQLDSRVTTAAGQGEPQGDLMGTRMIPDRFGDLSFAAGTARLTAPSREVVSRLAGFLKQHARYGVAVLGFTDNQGPPAATLKSFVQSNSKLEQQAPSHAQKVQAFNLALSSARARAVAQALVDNGVPARRIGARGFGDRRPIASNDTPEGRAANRRVVALLVPGPDSQARQQDGDGS